MVKSIKTNRNKTIDLDIEYGKEYLSRCIKLSHCCNLNSILNKTIHGDCLSVLQYLPKESIDLIIADPPYNLTKQYSNTVFKRTDKNVYETYTRNWVSLIAPLLKKNGSIYICCDWETSLIIGNVICDYFQLQNRITWQREKGRGAKSNWKNGMEDIWFATKNKEYTFNLNNVMVRRKVIAPYKENGQPKDWIETKDGNFRDTCPSNFWDDITVPFWSMPENTAHPAQKPEKLIAKLILASSDKGDVILDPFLGSGTTSVVAKKLERCYIGIEKEDQYCIWAEKRIENADHNSKIQGYTDGVFWERNTLAFQKKT